jgi:two-component system NtrC family response regulator
MNKPKLLIVDDDEGIRTQLKYALREHYVLSFSENRADALAQLREAQPHLVSLDLGLPPSPDTADEGLKALEEILAAAPQVKVIVMTGNTDRQNALRAVQLGAFDYHLKPIALDEYKVVLGRAAFLYTLGQETEAAARAEEQSSHFEEILGTTQAIREIFGIVERVAKTDATALIEGESGTGKELVARAIHTRSGRRAGPFVPINCGAIPETLLEAELFGHERGAFTGAHMQRKGKFEMADRGTLFLDEIGELPLTLQVKLLRFLQERTVERIGGRQAIPLDLRIIAATNRDLKVQLDRGLFREDLYYRLSVIRIQVPPLRERGEDIALLANVFLRRAAQAHRRRVRFSGDALRSLMVHHWPGNVRELENRVSRAVIMSRGHMIEPGDLDLQPAELEPAGSLRQARERVEREALVDVLSRHRGNISKAARTLKVSRPTLHGLLDKHNIDASTFR